MAFPRLAELSQALTAFYSAVPSYSTVYEHWTPFKRLLVGLCLTTFGFGYQFPYY